MTPIGEILRQERQSKKISINQVSEELKISKQTLINIEECKNINNTDTIYYIGHIRSYSKYLNLNSNEIINRFKREISFQKDDIATKIPKPNLENNLFNFHKLISPSLIILIFTSFYFLFIRETDNKLDYALIPDLPESYIPIIEKANLDSGIQKVQMSEDKNSNKNINFISANASNKSSNKSKNLDITLRILNSTWLQLKDESNNIILSRLMEKGEEYSYNMKDKYNLTAGNAGNILVIINTEVRGKVGKYGDVVDSIIIDNTFSK